MELARNIVEFVLAAILLVLIVASIVFFVAAFATFPVVLSIMCDNYLWLLGYVGYMIMLVVFYLAFIG